MPLHDWTRVEAAVFHDFHTGWVPAIRAALNGGLLPPGYYAMAEQHAGGRIADVLALHASPGEPLPLLPPLPPDTGGVAVAEAPPRVRHRFKVESLSRAKRRSIAIRHVSEHRLVALLEIVSPGNKDRAAHVQEFADKVVDAIESGVHVLVVDLFPPGRHDPYGIPGAVRQKMFRADEPVEDPRDVPNMAEPATLVSYASGPDAEAYIEHVGVGARLPDMPLFIRPDRYVNVPLEATYDAAYLGLPGYWRGVLEGRVLDDA